MPKDKLHKTCLSSGEEVLKACLPGISVFANKGFVFKQIDEMKTERPKL